MGYGKAYVPAHWMNYVCPKCGTSAFLPYNPETTCTKCHVRARCLGVKDSLHMKQSRIQKRR